MFKLASLVATTAAVSTASDKAAAAKKVETEAKSKFTDLEAGFPSLVFSGLSLVVDFTMPLPSTGKALTWNDPINDCNTCAFAGGVWDK
jgi:hypothetical protein